MTVDTATTTMTTEATAAPAAPVAPPPAIEPAPVNNVEADDDDSSSSEEDDDDEEEPKPNDEQLVHQLTTGKLPMTDQVSVCAQLGFRTTAKDHGHVGGLLAGKIGSNKFVADYAVDSRAKCRDTKCNAYILQSDLRIGKIPPSIKTGHSCRTHWYHLPCIFRSFRRACKGTKIITAVSDIANFDRLRREDQDQIRLCIQTAKNSRDRTEGAQVVTDGSVSSSPGRSIDDGKLTITVPPAPQKRKASKQPAGHQNKKNTTPENMGVSAHEVESILGLTMLSRDKSTDDPTPSTPPTLTTDQPSKNPPPAIAITPPAVAPPPVSVLDCSPRPARKQQQENIPHLPAFATDGGGNPEASVPVSTPSRWRPPGSTCEVLYHDKWHAGVVDRYTSSEAIIRFADDSTDQIDVAVHINLNSEKHRVCWKLGAMTSRSNFA